MGINALNINRHAQGVIDALDAGRPLSTKDSSWLRAGMSALLNGSDISEALGVKREHGKHNREAVSKADRNDKIRHRVCCIEQEGVTRTKAADRVAKELGSISGRQVLRITEPNTEEQSAGSINDLLCLWSNPR